MATTQSRVPRSVVNCQLSRFDLLLAAIPLALAAGIASSFVVSIPFFLGIATGAVSSAALVGYGIYVMTQQSTASADQPTPLTEQSRIE